MIQFYETYKDNEIVSILLTQINWSSHLLILSGTETSVGLILCASKGDTVVEYATARSYSSAVVAKYSLNIIDKHLLEDKLKELSRILS